MASNLPPGVHPSDPHIAGYDEFEQEDYCEDCETFQVFTATTLNRNEALLTCPDCGGEQVIDYSDLWPE